MLNTLRTACISKVQLQQVRLGHRVRGKAPIFCRTLKERIDELNHKDELYTTRIDIGFSRPRNSSSELRDARIEHTKKVKADKNLEQLARNHKLKVDLSEVRKEWLSTQGPQHKKQVADHYGIFEHLYGEGYFLPLKNLEIFYELKDGRSLPVYSGNVIKPAEALNCPTVNYESDGNSMWTLLLSSLDGHLNTSDKEYVHWFVANIPGNFIEKGDSIVEYLQPFPLKGTGYHRYVFVLYKQDGRITYDVPQVSSTSPLVARTFETREWYQKYQDQITPVGLAFYQTDWDYTVKDFFHNVLNQKEPGGKRAYGSPDGKRSPSPIDTCNTRGVTSALPPLRTKMECLYAIVISPVISPPHQNTTEQALLFGGRLAVYEYDFPEPYIKPQVWFPKKEPFNLYMDKYRDPKQIKKEYLLRKLKTEDPFVKPAPPLRFPNAHQLPHNMPSWLKLHEKKIRLKWGRVNDV